MLAYTYIFLLVWSAPTSALPVVPRGFINGSLAIPVGNVGAPSILQAFDVNMTVSSNASSTAEPAYPSVPIRPLSPEPGPAVSGAGPELFRPGMPLNQSKSQSSNNVEGTSSTDPAHPSARIDSLLHFPPRYMVTSVPYKISLTLPSFNRDFNASAILEGIKDQLSGNNSDPTNDGTAFSSSIVDSAIPSGSTENLPLPSPAGPVLAAAKVSYPMEIDPAGSRSVHPDGETFGPGSPGSGVRTHGTTKRTLMALAGARAGTTTMRRSALRSAVRRMGTMESEVGDGDATEEKWKKQTKQQVSYEDDSEEDEDEDMGEMDEAEIEAAYASDAGSAMDEDQPSKKGKKKKKSSALEAMVEKTSEAFLKNFSHATAFDFRPENCTIELKFGADVPKLLLVGIVERTCLKTIVREIPGIVDLFRVREPNKDGSINITTNGSNFKGLWEFATGEHRMIDENNIRSNDIYAILCTYGVEMARAAIVQEVSGVFNVYNIDVDIRHLELIADYMTFEGGYKPFNRKGISMHPSPLLKASFETTAAFLSEATLYGDFDDLRTPSSNLVLGRPSLSGTGVFDIVSPLAQAEVAA
ncbi:hypothetical protein EVG20_g9124 [Dentipellis fragilis]|uniref:DNA-directed RNA polymerase I subunit RPA1 n=1 Tax=Dentipellis fragilis TaxID=205917 RepID=A0A4Y9Y3G9_9AGAM|nr:hypothetical protein EVG20_g9124 [Dentipellis fragilis]